MTLPGAARKIFNRSIASSNEIRPASNAATISPFSSSRLAPHNKPHLVRRRSRRTHCPRRQHFLQLSPADS